MRLASEARRILTKFVSTIAIAAKEGSSIEGPGAGIFAKHQTSL